MRNNKGHHAFVDDGSDSPNCSVCHFHHSDPSRCKACGETAGKHCKECDACPGDHGYWCSKA